MARMNLSPTGAEGSLRGLREDLFTPGWFRAEGTGSIDVEFRAAATFGIAAMAEPRAGTC